MVRQRAQVFGAGASDLLILVLFAMLGALVGNLAFVGGTPAANHPNHDCLQGTWCNSVVSDNNPACPAGFTTCAGSGTSIFWKCIPPSQNDCNEDAGRLGSTTCAGWCGKEIAPNTYQLAQPLVACSYTLNHCQ